MMLVEEKTASEQNSKLQAKQDCLNISRIFLETLFKPLIMLVKKKRIASRRKEQL